MEMSNDGNLGLEFNSIKVLQIIMNMYSRGESKVLIFDTILSHLIKTTNAEVGLITQLIKKDGKDFHEFISYELKDIICYDAMRKCMNSEGGYYLNSSNDRLSLIRRTYESDNFVIENSDNLKIDYSNFPDEHFKIKNFIGMPLKTHGKNNGMICLVNRYKGESLLDFDIKIYKVIEPLVEVCNLLLHSVHMSSLEFIYEKIVQHLVIPVVVYKGGCSYTPNFDIEKLISNFRCIIVNKAFCKKACPPDNEVVVQILNHTLFESFPNFMTVEKLSSTLIEMFTTKSSKSITCIEYEDYLFSKSEYQFNFCYIDDSSFIMSIDDISDKIRARNIVDDIVRSKEEFIANISHEMRTPLNGIIGYTALIMDTHLNEYQKDCFSTIKECSMNLLYRVNDLLDLSKLTAGKMELLKEDFSLPDCVSTSYDINSLDAKKKNLDVSYFIEPDVPYIINGDGHKLQQILVNLLNNAIKFTDTGKINTHIKLINDKKTKNKLDVRNRYTIEFTVSDTGIGIQKENLSKLFTPFNQLYPNDHVNSGTGLGLVITKKLCHLMGGDVHAESIYGKGSKFIFHIKCKGVDVTHPSSVQETKILLNKKVLVVDNNEMNRVMICSFLNEWGMIPISCSSSKEAIFYVKRNIMNFDLALLDLSMPHTDGNKLANDINAHDKCINLVALSSVLPSSHEINKKFKYYLTNPIKCAKLKQVCIDIFSNVASQKPKSNLDNKIINLNSPSEKYFNISPNNSTQMFNRAKIILAEDIQINQKVTIQILKKLGYKNIEMSKNGKKLLDRIKACSLDYNIILMDLKMPVMDGFEAAIEIDKLYNTREYSERTKPKIIALTARVMSGVKQKCLDSGMNDYITKPMDINLLNKKIQNLLK